MLIVQSWRVQTLKVIFSIFLLHDTDLRPHVIL